MAHHQIFVNLPVRDMARSQAFWRALGYAFDPRFTDPQGACLVLGEGIHAMLLVEPFFQGFLGHRRIADTRETAQVLLALRFDSRQAVDAFVRQALAAGGRVAREPQDHGFMYAQAIEDLDGHVWEPFWMDADAMPPRD